MEWKADFKRAVVSFKQGHWEESLGLMNKVRQGIPVRHFVHSLVLDRLSKTAVISSTLFMIPVQRFTRRWERFERR
jgi:hypothetical protein